MSQQVFNPYLPNYEYIPDGEPYVFDGRLYVYGSHDRFGARSFCENDYVLWSAPVEDLSAWRYDGVIFRRDQDPANPGGKYPLFAPDIQKGADGKYYLYYAPCGADVIGVAVSESPAGPFAFWGHVTFSDGRELGSVPQDGFPFDPGVFLDEDGQMYLYYGFTPLCPTEQEARIAKGLYMVKLAPDMKTIQGVPYKMEIQNVPEWGYDFFEASSMRKINGRYTFIYSSCNSHELCYALGSSPLGPFTYGGVIHSNGDIGYHGRKPEDRVSYTGNNHGSLVEIQGKWYIFAHRHTNYTSFSRQGVAEPVEILPDGTIPQVEMTSCGLNGGPLEGLGYYGAYIACALRSREGACYYEDNSEGPEFANLRTDHPVFTQDGPDRMDNPNQHIANMRDGAQAGFKYFQINETGRISVVTRGAGGKFVLSTSPEGASCGEIAFDAATDWTESASAPVALPKGKQALYFTYVGEGVVDFMGFRLEK